MTFSDQVTHTVILSRRKRRGMYPERNQELYGQPTKLPWSIAIDAAHRIDIYKDLAQYPLETTRFHPTFAYEMLWNFLAFALIMYLAHRFVDRLKPGTVFFVWLLLAGLGRFLIEFFRPDQPHLANSWLSFTQLATIIMMLIGMFMLIIRFDILKLPFRSLPETYQISG